MEWSLRAVGCGFCNTLLAALRTFDRLGTKISGDAERDEIMQHKKGPARKSGAFDFQMASLSSMASAAMPTPTAGMAAAVCVGPPPRVSTGGVSSRRPAVGSD